MEAYFQAGETSAVPVYAVFDNEEVGSGTKQGAGSTFLFDTLRRICLAMGKGEEGYYTALASSFMVSADNAHAIHPNHPEYADPTNPVYMNKGIVVKSNANQKYTTDAVSAALFKEICRKAGVPVQTFANRSDMAGGSTRGNISNSQVSLNTVDIGLAQLAMHSSYETAGTLDVDYMIQALTVYYSTAIQAEEEAEQAEKETKQAEEEAKKEEKAAQKAAAADRAVIKINTLLVNANAALEEGRTARARELYQQARSRYNKFSGSTEDADKLFQDLTALGQAITEAEVKAKEAAKEERASQAAQYAIQAKEAARGGDRKTAQTLYEKALAIYQELNIWDEKTEALYDALDELKNETQPNQDNVQNSEQGEAQNEPQE